MNAGGGSRERNGLAELEQPRLLFRDESGVQHAFALDRGRALTIGRGEAADIRVAWDPSVSLVHAEATHLGGHWMISDDGVSRNGTFVNGERISGRRRLRDGDVVRVGRTTLSFIDPSVPRRDATTISDPSSASTTVTLLFTDLVGSTELMSRLGEEASERMRREHFELLRRAAGEQGGREVKSLGDGLMLSFTSALGAVTAAVTMQRRLAAYIHERGERAIALRVGLNAGEVIAVEDDYFGAPVVVAKRLCDQASSGQILASETVRSLTGDRGKRLFTPLGTMRLKGFPEPIGAFEVDWRAG
jgi:class 3 adenylate cyclase